MVLEAPDANREALVRYIVENRHVEPKADGNWRFAPWPANVIATFETSPASAAPPRRSASNSRRWAMRRAASSNIGSNWVERARADLGPRPIGPQQGHDEFVAIDAME